MARDEGVNAMTEQGTLFGVGVGPGDPKLMTIKAGEVIRDADVLAYPVNGSGESHARSIAAPIIEAGASELPIHLPMKVEREPAQNAYDNAVIAIKRHLDEGRDVAYLCVGDPLFYGSFMYLAARLGNTHPIEIVPGITSLSACAALTRTPLAGRNDILSVIPATLGEAAMATALERADTAAIIKVGRHFQKVRRLLYSLGIADKAIVIENGTADGERITPLEDIAEETHPYFSTILLRRNRVT